MRRDGNLVATLSSKLDLPTISMWAGRAGRGAGRQAMSPLTNQWGYLTYGSATGGAVSTIGRVRDPHA